MATGTIAVREALGTDVPGVTDREIQEGLWHYYYDVGKTVEWILDTRTGKGSDARGGGGKKGKKKKGGLDASFCLRSLHEFEYDLSWGLG